MENGKLKVALIGAGQIARVSHIPNYKEMEDVTVAGICDTRLESAKALAEQFGIPSYYTPQSPLSLLRTTLTDQRIGSPTQY